MYKEQECRLSVSPEWW